jgi:hypothetical protein
VMYLERMCICVTRPLKDSEVPIRF